jgi:hypothetical protein
MGSPVYRSMTIRSWATTIALLRLLDETEDGRDAAPALSSADGSS